MKKLRLKIPFTRRSLELRFLAGEEPDAKWMSLFGSATSAGVPVNEETAMRLSTVYACIRVLSESLAQLPLKVYERLPGGGKREAPDHPLYPLLHLRPDPERTAYSWKETSMGHLCSWGNSYSYIEHGRDGRVKAIRLLKPTNVTPRRLVENDQLVYDVNDSRGAPLRFLPEQILHVPCLGFDGVMGYSPIRMAAETIGIGIAAEQHSASTFGNGAMPSGILSYEGELDDEALQRLKTDWKNSFSGAKNVGNTAVLEGSMKYTPLTISALDAQLIETLKFNRSEIAGIFRVPGHLINDLEHATYSNIDQLSLEFVMFTLAPHLTRYEQAMNWRLFLPSERGRYFVEFVTDGLLRGDVKSRYEAYRTAISSGMKSINEVRASENLPPIADGDEHLVQGAMITLNKAVAEGRKQAQGGEKKE